MPRRSFIIDESGGGSCQSAEGCDNGNTLRASMFLSPAPIKQLAARRFRLQHEVQLMTKLLWGGGSAPLDNSEGGSGQQWPTAGGRSPRTGVQDGRNITQAYRWQKGSASVSRFLWINSTSFHDGESRRSEPVQRRHCTALDRPLPGPPTELALVPLSSCYLAMAQNVNLLCVTTFSLDAIEMEELVPKEPSVPLQSINGERHYRSRIGFILSMVQLHCI